MINTENSSRSGLSGQPLIDYMASYLLVNYVSSAAGADIILTNSGRLDIPPGSYWSIYFNHAGMIALRRTYHALTWWSIVISLLSLEDVTVGLRFGPL